MRNYRQTKRDSNHKDIVEHLKAHGVEVIDCASTGGGFTDLITHKNCTGFLEIKPSGDGKIMISQLKFIVELISIPVQICKTKESALVFALDPNKNGLNCRQKFKIRQWLDGNTRAQDWITCAQFEREIFSFS